jgi:hypothetical protein
VALILTIREIHGGRAIAAGFAGAMAGFCVVGLVGSLLDNPRPAFLFFVILFWSLHARFAAPRGPSLPGRAFAAQAAARGVSRSA